MTENVLKQQGNGMKMLLLLMLGIFGGFFGGILLLTASAYLGLLAIPGVLLLLCGFVSVVCLTGLHVLSPRRPWC